MLTEEIVKKARKTNPRTDVSKDLWKTDVKIYAEKIIKFGICPLFQDLGIQITDGLRQRLNNSKDAKIFDCEEFAEYALRSNIIETGVEDLSNRNELKEQIKQTTYGKAVLKCIIDREIDGKTDKGFYPVMNETAATYDKKD